MSVQTVEHTLSRQRSDLHHGVRNYFDGDGHPVLVTHFNNRDDVSLREFLFDKLGIPVEEFDLQYSSMLEVIKGVFEYLKQLANPEVLQNIHETFDKSIETLSQLMATATQFWYDVVVTTSLDEITDLGFNAHNRGHINAVRRDALLLAREAGCNPMEQIMIVIVVELHDMFNAFNRKLHAVGGATWFNTLMRTVGVPFHLRHTVAQAIEAHDEPMVLPYIQAYVEQGQTEERILEFLRREVGSVGLPVVIADKTQVDNERVSPGVRTTDSPEWIMRALKNDTFLLVDLWCRNNGLVFEGDTLTWNLNFNLLFVEDLRNAAGEEFLTLVRSDEDEKRLFVPDYMKKRDDDGEKIPYFYSWIELFGTLHQHRIHYLVWAVFALYPHLQNFRIVMNDQEREQEEEFLFTRGQLIQQLKGHPFRKTRG